MSFWFSLFFSTNLPGFVSKSAVSAGPTRGGRKAWSNHFGSARQRFSNSLNASSRGEVALATFRLDARFSERIDQSSRSFSEHL